MNGAILYGNEVLYGTSSETDFSLLLSGVDLGETLQSDSYCLQYAEAMETTSTSIKLTAKVDESELEYKFERLTCQWLEETKFSSSISDIISHPAHMRIIGMGSQVIPLILRRLSKRTELWFWALSSITDEDPITDDIRGNVQEMRRVWLEWGQENGAFSF